MPSPQRRRTLTGTMILLLVLLAAAILLTRTWPRGAPRTVAPTPAVAAQGQTLYAAACADCHGERGEGYAQPALPAPALDHSEHAWHHPDWQIAGLIRQGGGGMPAVGADWSAPEVAAVLAYIKAWWTPEQRAYQEAASRQPR